MSNTHTSISSLQQKRMSILSDFSIEITVKENIYNLPMDTLFSMAARINKKRAFLFVSKVLGKHIPVNPMIPLSIGKLLAAKYANIDDEKIINPLLANINKNEKNNINSFIKNNNPIVIGFAETATALGHSFFSAFQGASFIHTTREQYKTIKPTITFEEEHSHATSHYVYAPAHFFDNEREIILVDDELTTGKTNLNIIRSLHKEYPRKKYSVVSILDWRTEEHLLNYKKLEEELNISIQSVSLLKGVFELLGEPKLKEEQFCIKNQNHLNISKVYINNLVKQKGYEKLDDCMQFVLQGRFSLENNDEVLLNEWSKQIAEQIDIEENHTVLCIGTGEFMYLPMLIASQLKGQVFFQSTTRSPIYQVNIDSYGAKSKIQFPNFENALLPNYLYNLTAHKYDTIVLFLEKEYSESQLNPLLSQLDAQKIVQLIF